MTTLNLPADFPGTDAEREANRRTHLFIGERCDNCDCRPYGRVATWPCGASVPRVTVENTPEAVMTEVIRTLVGA